MPTIPSIGGDIVILIQFIDIMPGINAWHTDLGYSHNQIYKKYPCFVAGVIGVAIACDLYTYSKVKGPYTQLFVGSDYSGPYFMIYGFVGATATGTIVTIDLPKILIGNLVNINADIGLSILQ